MIYAMTMEDGKFVKVGYTKHSDVEKRAAKLQTGTPYYIKTEFCVEGSLMQELAIHGALKMAFHRIRIKLPGNEWYPARHPFMQTFIRTLRNQGPNAALEMAERYNPAVKQWGTGAKFTEKNRARQFDEMAWGR